MVDTQNVKCWAALEQKGECKPWTYKPRDVQPNDVDIRILACGMCGSDLHQMDGGWGSKIFPMVPGHEIVGEVVSVGPNVTALKKGDRVGVGPQCWSCGTCADCKQGEEIVCPKVVWTYNSKYADGTIAYGGYSTFVRVDARFAIKIPDNLPTEAVAPLLCAGVTTYTPLVRFGYGKGHRVAIIGIGGLGHMAIKWAVALGCEVTAISSSPKEEDAKRLGAHHFINSKDKDAMKSKDRYFDAILSTASASLKWGHYINMLKAQGRLIFVGLPEEELRFAPFDFTSKNTQVCGSSVGSPHDIENMLKLASEKNILPDVQVWPIEKVNEALAEFRAGKPKYRFVLKIADK